MRISDINEGFNSHDIDIIIWDDMSDDYDPSILSNQAYDIAEESAIGILSNKELLLVAVDNSYYVHGAVWYAIYDDADYSVFDFDVAVRPTSRSGMIGMRLIDAAISEYEELRHAYDNLIIKTLVVNPKLIRVLKRKYGFEILSREHGNSAYMTFGV